MPVNAIQFGNVYGVKNIQAAQARYVNQAHTANAVKDADLHPVVKGGHLGNRLDLLA